MAENTVCLKVPVVRPDFCTCRNYNLTITSEPSQNLPPKLPVFPNLVKCMQNWTCALVNSHCAPCPPNETTTGAPPSGTTPVPSNDTIGPPTPSQEPGCPCLCALLLLLCFLIAAIAYRMWQIHQHKGKRSASCANDPPSSHACANSSPQISLLGKSGEVKVRPLAHENETVHKAELAGPTSQDVYPSAAEDETKVSGSATVEAIKPEFKVEQKDEPPGQKPDKDETSGKHPEMVAGVKTAAHNETKL